MRKNSRSRRSDWSKMFHSIARPRPFLRTHRGLCRGPPPRRTVCLMVVFQWSYDPMEANSTHTIYSLVFSMITLLCN